ncbi:hypothetical protein O181_039447 [Austropuccinia psidii MF-1]|uniref:Uncharacterized protein n=1 Tax=Austropuccinia psidii MF-1 TaxID=1389203 RepID=A0A9Q3DCX2_9BASI|nr:hypothetical protein [Austropuccinia psidii MF-1]
MIHERRYAKSTTCTLKVENPKKVHDATENFIAHSSFRKLDEKGTSQCAHIPESIQIERKIQAKFFSHGKPDRLLILKDVYSKVKKIKKDSLQGRRPIDALIDSLKKENLVWSSERDTEGQIYSLFCTHPLAINLLQRFPHFILMEHIYKSNQ